MVGGYTVDANGVEADDINSPVRPVYIYGTLANVQTPQLTLEFVGQDEEIAVDMKAGPTIINQSGILSALDGGFVL